MTGIRAVMAYWVVCHHLLPVDPALTPLFTLVLRGATGVDVFFILSGFILTYSYQRQDISDRTFWLRRAARIYPVYLAGMALFTPFIVINLADSHASIMDVSLRMLVYGLAALLLIQAWLPKLALAWNGPGWSLSAEAFFYALFPSLLRRLESRKLTITAATAAICYVFYLLPHAVGQALPEAISSNYQWIFFMTFNPLLRLPEFIIGICLGRLLLEGQGRTVGKFTFLILAVFLAAASFGSELVFRALAAPLICLLLASLFFGRGPTCRLFASPPVALLGHASYAVYILHIPVAYWYNWLKMGDPKAVFTLMDFVLYLVILTGLALLSYRFIERPANDALRRLIARKAAVRDRLVAAG